MAQDKPVPASMLKDLITAKRPTTVEDEYGDLTVASETTVATFWGNVKEDKPSVALTTGKTRQSKIVTITARDRDVSDIDLHDELSFGNSEDVFIVRDFYESEWRWATTIVAEFTN